MTQAQYAQEQPSENPLTRQIGPLKTWQWALVVVGAYFVYKFVLGGGGSSSSGSTSGTAFVPASDGSSNSTTDPTSTSTVSKVAQTLLYYTASFTKKTAIRDKAGKTTGQYIAAGKSLVLGKRVKVNGMWLYPILNMPGKYIAAGSGYALKPIYADTTTTTTTTTTPALDATVQAANRVIGTTATGLTDLGTVQIGAPAQSTVPVFNTASVDFATTSTGTPTTVDRTNVPSTAAVKSPAITR